MHRTHSVLPLLPAVLAALLSSQLTAAQTNPALVPVSMVVTVQSHRGSDVPVIDGGNLAVYQNRSRAKVTDSVALRGSRAGLELFLLLDDSPNVNQRTQLEDIRRFILAQPRTTKVGVAYMQTGGPRIEQGLTTDHALAAEALHVPLARLASSANPYLSLSGLMENWPATENRREILMISNGIDALEGSGTGEYDGYVDAAIDKAQRGGIIVFTIANFRANPDSSRPDDSLAPGRDFPRSAAASYGQNFLARIAEETGGVTYSYPSAVSFAPYFDDLNRRLDGQYLVTFLADAKDDSGMQSVKISTDIPHTKLVSAKKVYVSAAGNSGLILPTHIN
jgi:hypothetical protein